MKFEVAFTSLAERQLGELWLKSSQRDELSQAAFRLEQELARNGREAGESREGVRRVCFESPLGILFLVHPERNAVLVIRVWTFQR